MIIVLFAFVITVLVGFLTDSIFASWNWPDAGSIFAIATMGAFLLWSNQKRGE